MEHIDLQFEKMTNKQLLEHFIKSSGFGYSGSYRNGKFHFNGPDWDEDWNPLNRQQVIDELNERKRVDEEDDGDWFNYL